MEPALSKPPALNSSGKTLLHSERVQQFIELMIEGEELPAAAKQAGLRVKRARNIISDPAVRRYYFRQMEVLSESERARNILLRRQIRNRGLDPQAPAALAKVALEAARQLDGDDKPGGITINGGNNVIAGYVIDLGGEVEGPRAITNRSADDAKSLINREDVTDVDG
jgi:hypothetical protein